jgi:hypothetical protein
MKNRDKYREGFHLWQYHKVGIFLTAALIEQTAEAGSPKTEDYFSSW